MLLVIARLRYCYDREVLIANKYFDGKRHSFKSAIEKSEVEKRKKFKDTHLCCPCQWEANPSPYLPTLVTPYIFEIMQSESRRHPSFLSMSVGSKPRPYLPTLVTPYIFRERERERESCR